MLSNIEWFNQDLQTPNTKKTIMEYIDNSKLFFIYTNGMFIEVNKQIIMETFNKLEEKRNNFARLEYSDPSGAIFIIHL